ncbi:hypothetical protein TNCV_1531191 [Trichonephila clavipes]|nr:hypothetical protein TNCV_1531191 [Trichonephila clavipes]
MSSVREAELCHTLGVFPVVWRQNSAVRQSYVQCPGGRTLSCVRGISIGLDPELCPASELCPLSGRKNSVMREGIYRGLDPELCPASELCPLSGRKNSVMREGYLQRPGSRTLSCVRIMSSVWV